MKVVLVHIVRGRVDQDMMVYPNKYNPAEVDRRGLGPCSVNGAGAYSDTLDAVAKKNGVSLH